MKIVVTGAQGFIGKNLVARLSQQADHQLFSFGHQDPWSALAARLAQADIVFHLAGVNRPQSVEEFHTGNVDFTQQICDQLATTGRAVPLVLASSMQATLDNPYGVSKRQAEEIVRAYAAQNQARVAIYRLPGVFGKWCRPNYNSVVATFCYNIAHDLPITVNDPTRLLELVYIDDVITHFLQQLVGIATGVTMPMVEPIQQITLSALADQIHSFRQSRQTLQAPGVTDPFVHKLYATYLSYLAADDFGYQLEKRSDQRGSLAEFIKLPAFGQIFVSRTKPGITRGNHYHHTKTEKFLVLEGDAIVRFRALDNSAVIEYPVKGNEYQVVDIPPGYTHSIENVGDSELVTLFWASEVFDPHHPDTYYIPVLETEEQKAG